MDKSETPYRCACNISSGGGELSSLLERDPAWASAEESDDGGVASACFISMLLAPRAALEASFLEVLAVASGCSTLREEPSVLPANLTLRRTTVGVVAGASMPTQGTSLSKKSPQCIHLRRA